MVGETVGFDHYLVKPCDPREVIALMEPLRGGQARETGNP
jgi:DNA-binding response OmpR family regulator